MNKQEKTPKITDAERRLLLNSTTADFWAAEFVRLHGGDEGLMLAWFANAIEVGRAAEKSARKSASGEISMTAGRMLPSLSDLKRSMMAHMSLGHRGV